MKNAITVHFDELITFSHMARTLDPSDLGYQDSGWIIEGEVMEDWYEWVNDFEAFHPDYGVVSGNYETSITGYSQEAVDHFMKHHPAYEWDYWDI